MAGRTVPPTHISVVRYCSCTRPSGHTQQRAWVIGFDRMALAFLSPGYPVVGTRQGAVVQRIFRTWIPLLGIDTVGNLLRLQDTTPGNNTLQFLRQLKLRLYEAIQVHALQYLQSKVSLQLLPGGVSWTWLTHLATVPKLAVNALLSCGGR